MSVIKRIKKDKNGKKTLRYQVELFVEGARIKTKTFRTKAEADAWHVEEKKKLLSGEPQKLGRSQKFFSEVLAAYKRDRVPELRRSSQQVVENRMRYVEIDFLLNQRMSHFDGSVVDKWIKTLLRLPTAKDPSRKSFDKELTTLTAVLNWYRNFQDESFVVPVVKRHKNAVRYKKVLPRRPDHYIRQEDMLVWLCYMKLEREHKVYFRLAMFMVHTGVRVGEAAGLCWDAVDLDQRQVTIRRSVSWDHSTREPMLVDDVKNHSSFRVIKIPEIICKIFKEMLSEVSPLRAKTRPVFLRCDALLGYRGIQHRFNVGFKKAGLPFRSTHILRHTYATFALLTTRDVSAVQSTLGHTNVRQTEHYAKNIALRDGKVVDAVADYLS